MEAPSLSSCVPTASGVRTRRSALAAAADQWRDSKVGVAMHAVEGGAGNLSKTAGPKVDVPVGLCATARLTDSPTPHARSMGSEATWGLRDRERSRQRSYTPQPWVSGTSGESSQVLEPALDRLRASPAPGGGPFAQAPGRAAWMREPARESASPMSRPQASMPDGLAPDGRSMSRQPSGGMLLPPGAWRTSTPSARAREPRRLCNTLSMESVSASAAGSPGFRASSSPPPASAASHDAAPSHQQMPPPATVARRQRPPRAADVTAAARGAAADALDARRPLAERGGPGAARNAADQPAVEQLATIGESGAQDEDGVAAVPRGELWPEHEQGQHWIGIWKDAAGMWQITLKVCLARSPL